MKRHLLSIVGSATIAHLRMVEIKRGKRDGIVLSVIYTSGMSLLFVIVVLTVGFPTLV